MSYREFLRDCAEWLDTAAGRNPYFWVGLREELGRVHLAQGAREHRSTQTVAPERDAPAPPLMVDRAVQTGSEDEQTSDVAGSERVTSTRRRDPSFSYLFPPTGCWNCGGPGHRYSQCPQPRRQFYYRCGNENRTIWECPDCREGWKAEGPHRARRGTPSPDHPRSPKSPPPLRGKARRLR